MLRPRVPALEAEVARLQVDVQDRNKGLRDAQNEEGLARAEVSCLLFPSVSTGEKEVHAHKHMRNDTLYLPGREEYALHMRNDTKHKNVSSRLEASKVKAVSTSCQSLCWKLCMVELLLSARLCPLEYILTPFDCCLCSQSSVHK